MQKKIPEAAIRRLPVYLRVLDELIEDGVEVTSSADLAGRTGLSSEQIRKDLAYFGAFGTRGVGYDTCLLNRRIKKILGLTHPAKVALVGVGNLGTALIRYNLAQPKDIHITAAFDADPRKVGFRLGELEVQNPERMEQVIRSQGIKMAVLTVPAQEAQLVAEQLAVAGVEAILNFSPVKLKVPGVYVQDVDLTIELQSLAYYTNGAEAAVSGKV